MCYTDGRKRSGGSNPPRPARQQSHPDRPSEAGRELGSGFRAVIRFQQTAPRARINILLLSDECDVKAPVSVSLKRICVVHSPCATQHGEMAERIKAAVPKTAVHPVHRRFESYSHRQKTNRGYGGIGRRNGLRRRGRKTCRFESCYPHHEYVPLAQLDRAPHYECGERGFESLMVRHTAGLQKARRGRHASQSFTRLDTWHPRETTRNMPAHPVACGGLPLGRRNAVPPPPMLE